MDKKTIPLIVVLVIILIAYWPIVKFLGLSKDDQTPPADTVITDTQTTQPAEQPSSPSTEIPSGEISTTTPPTSTQTIDTALVSAATDTLPVDTIRIKTNKYEIVSISRGGGPVSIILRDYFYRDGKPIQMIPDPKGVAMAATFSGGTFTTSDLSFKSSLEPGDYDATVNPVELEYRYDSPDAGAIIKKFTFYPDDYHYDMTFEVVDPSGLGFERQYNMVWQNPLGVTEPDPKTDYAAMEIVAMMSGSRENLDDFDEGKLKQTLTGYTDWVGLRSKYFAAAIIPRNRNADGALAMGTKYKINTPDGKVEIKKMIGGLDMPFAVVPEFADTFTVFVGPLDYPLMSEYNVDLEKMLGIGTTPYIGWLIKPFAIAIMWLLPKMYSVIPNYGLVIIIFAILVKIVTLPLSMKSFKSMNMMKELQPVMEELRTKYKKNPQQLNQEMMKLYKKHGVNPMSGCLPILPQMPLFFALFSVFKSTILLRDASFVWFINDLSRGATGLTDPYIILVVLMIGTQFISQKLTMASTQQNKALMYVMPLFFGFLFYKFAAGLVLYWACFSGLSILDYFLFKRDKNTQVQTT